MNHTRVLYKEPDDKWWHTNSRFTARPGDVVTLMIKGKPHRYITQASDRYCEGCPFNIEVLNICTINAGKEGYPLCIQEDGTTLKALDEVMEEI